MGVPDFELEAIPMRSASGVQSIENYPLQVGDEQVWIHALSVGNPQCVVFVDLSTLYTVYRQSLYTAYTSGQGLQLGCPEEIAFRKGWISANALEKRASLFSQNNYGKYLQSLLEQ